MQPLKKKSTSSAAAKPLGYSEGADGPLFLCKEKLQKKGKGSHPPASSATCGRRTDISAIASHIEDADPFKGTGALPPPVVGAGAFEETIDPQFGAYLDDSRKAVRICPTMMSLVGSGGELDPEKCRAVSCFWCRHRFQTAPVGCPTRYVPAQIERTLTSPVTKETYTIRENVSQKAILAAGGDYYETDGVFCSYQCCLAYIQDNKTNPLYALSKTLLSNMWLSTSPGLPSERGKLMPAPSWRMLREYGGTLTIDEFRARHTHYTYRETHTVHRVPLAPRAVSLKPIVPMFEEKRHL